MSNQVVCPFGLLYGSNETCDSCISKTICSGKETVEEFISKNIGADDVPDVDENNIDPEDMTPAQLKRGAMKEVLNIIPKNTPVEIAIVAATFLDIMFAGFFVAPLERYYENFEKDATDFAMNMANLLSRGLIPAHGSKTFELWMEGAGIDRTYVNRKAVEASKKLDIGTMGEEDTGKDGGTKH